MRRQKLISSWIFELEDDNDVLGLHLVLLPIGGDGGGVGSGRVLPLEENPRCARGVGAAWMPLRGLRLFQLSLLPVVLIVVVVLVVVPFVPVVRLLDRC